VRAKEQGRNAEVHRINYFVQQIPRALKCRLW